jgi:hypothetical protein
MRLLSRLLIVLVVCLVAIALPAAPAQAASPVITLSPISGVPGDTVRVYGYNFTPNEWVDIYYCLNTTCLTTARTWVADVETDEDGDFEKTFTVPESYKGDHKVRAEEDSPSAYVVEAIFTVKPGVTVSPEEGPVGTNVTVEGHGFAADEGGIELRYYLNSTDYEPIPGNITANATGSWQYSFKIPSSAQGNHKIDAKGANSTLTAVKDATFEVTPGISLDKLSSSVGENITMTGDGFYARERDIKILFADKEVSTDPLDVRADDSGHWSTAFQVPEMSKGTYNVTAYGESTPKAAITALSFNITPGLVLSPDEGHVDTDLTVTGGGFPINEDVSIKYDGSQKSTATTNNTGGFEASFVVPESQHGEHNVTAEDAAGNNATANFTMESDPPADTPELISPLDGSRVGFIGKIRPIFEWSEVSDDSGVYYSLQIAASANTTTGGFVDPIVSIEGLVGTNYTLNATEALPYGTYYWIVQAVDRAENAGNWTAARSLHAGLLPLWIFIASIVAIVVLIGALVYFFIIRRRTHYYY